jgi:two-component system NarL family sensor kinase
LLFGVARELLSNVLKHAEARSARVSLGLYGDRARLIVADDGRGMDEQVRGQRLDKGHIGLLSQTLRVEAAGGTLTVHGDASGSVATAVVPVTPSS